MNIIRKLVPDTKDINAYLIPSEIINFKHEAIQVVSQQFLRTTETEIEQVKAIYEFVRDRVSHSLHTLRDAIWDLRECPYLA